MALNHIHKNALRLYDLLWSCALPGLRRNRRLARGFAQRLMKTAPPAARLWIQAASAGEAYLAAEIIGSLAPAEALNVLITSNTDQGIGILQRALADRTSISERIRVDIAYFPFDKPAIMQKAVRAIRPEVMVLLETEIWPGLLAALKIYGCRLFIVNGRLTSRSLRHYLLWPSIWKEIGPDKILAISRPDARRFQWLFGPEKVEVMPNIKFERMTPAPAVDDRSDPLRAVVAPETPFALLASIRREEEAPVGRIVRQVLCKRPQAVIGLFPRHTHRLAYWRKSLAQSGTACALRSKTAEPVPPGTVVLWDTFGELTAAYRKAWCAFIGGSLAPLGGQNFLEALSGGVIPVSGPSWENFEWVGREIVDCGLLKIAADWQEVAALLSKGLEQRPSREQTIAAVNHFIRMRRGGTRAACQLITGALEGS